MLQLVTAIPDVDALLALEPEELGARMLFLIRSRPDAAPFNLSTLRGELWTQNLDRQLYPRHRKAEIDLAIAEAFAWLEAQGLIVPASAGNGWRHLSRRARKFENETDFRSFATARLLSKEMLHPKISRPAKLRCHTVPDLRSSRAAR
jgi:hypothetical protein